MTQPVAPAAGVHLPWAQVPEAVRSWAADVGGAGEAPVAIRDLPGGFSPGATTVLEWTGRAVFVKAVGPELNAESPSMHRREAVVSAALPSTPRPTGTPRPSISGTGQMPDPRRKFDTGQWATPVPVSPAIPISRSLR